MPFTWKKRSTVTFIRGSNRCFSTIRKKLVAFFVVLIVANVSGPSRADDPYPIPVVTSLTGPLAFAGQNEADALRILEKEVNRNGGIAGRSIHFAIQDDQSNTVIALQLANQLIAKGAPLILGPVSTGACNAIAPLVENGPVVYCFAPSIRPPENSFMFSAGISSTDIDAVDIRYMRLSGWTKIAIIATSDAVGQDGEAGFEVALAFPENKGKITIVDRERFGAIDLTVDAQMSRIKASGAQAVFVYAVGTPFGTVLRSVFQSDPKMPIFTTAANFNYRQLESYASFIPDNLYMALASYIAPDVLPPALKTEVRTYLQAIKTAGLRPAQAQTSSWDPGLLAISALRSLGSTATAAQIRSHISRLTAFPGTQGVYDFRKRPQRGVDGEWVFVSRWDSPKDTMVQVSKAGGTP